MLSKILGLFKRKNDPMVEMDYPSLLEDIMRNKPKLVYTFSNVKHRFNHSVKVRTDNLEELSNKLKKLIKLIDRRDFIGMKDMFFELSERELRTIDLDDFLLDSRRGYYRDNRLIHELEAITNNIKSLIEKADKDFDVKLATTTPASMSLLQDLWVVFYKPF